MSKRKNKSVAEWTADAVAASGSVEEVANDSRHEEKQIPLHEEDLDERLKAAESRADENYERLLRVTAEFENYKKRTERQMNEFRKFATEAFVKDILPIVDNLERAIQTPYGYNENAFQDMRDGVAMTLKGLLDSLAKVGVIAIESLDKPFDPNFHQAVSQETSEELADNTVCQELQKGYIMNERLLRPAMVVVSKRPDANPDVKSEEHQKGKKVEVTI